MPFLKKIFRQILPFDIKRWIRRRINKSILDKSLSLNKTDQKVISQLKKHPGCILMTGYKKSGNTWVRFLIFNYFNILYNGADKTLTYQELSDIQHQYLDPIYQMGHCEEFVFKKNFPPIIRSQQPYRGIFQHFDKVLYVYRHPLDTLISDYFFMKNRPVPFPGFPEDEKKNLFSIDYYVLSELDKWIDHYKRTVERCHCTICYEDLRVDTLKEVKRVFSVLNFPLDEEAMKKTVALSSFDNVKKMGREKKQTYGHVKDLKSEFTRSGETGQYAHMLREETLRKAKKILKTNHLDFPV